MRRLRHLPLIRRAGARRQHWTRGLQNLPHGHPRAVLRRRGSDGQGRRVRRHVRLPHHSGRREDPDTAGAVSVLGREQPGAGEREFGGVLPAEDRAGDDR